MARAREATSIKKISLGQKLCLILGGIWMSVKILASTLRGTTIRSPIGWNERQELKLTLSVVRILSMTARDTANANE